jgi:outer membrane protein assembly factor BamB
VGDVLVYSESHSSHLIALSIENGQTRWSVEVGTQCDFHWPSPAVVSGQAILPRHDGGLYAVDLADGAVEWSVYLGTASADGVFPRGAGDEFCSVGTGYSILSSPAVAPSGVVVVGTLEGFLLAVGDRSW